MKNKLRKALDKKMKESRPEGLERAIENTKNDELIEKFTQAERFKYPTQLKRMKEDYFKLTNVDLDDAITEVVSHWEWELLEELFDDANDEAYSGYMRGRMSQLDSQGCSLTTIIEELEEDY